VCEDGTWLFNNNGIIECKTTISISKCNNTICNNGKCDDSSGDIICNCNNGYTGLYCDINNSEIDKKLSSLEKDIDKLIKKDSYDYETVNTVIENEFIKETIKQISVLYQYSNKTKSSTFDKIKELTKNAVQFYTNSNLEILS